MPNNIHSILLCSILIISIYYYSKVNKKIIKAAIAAFAGYSLAGLLKDYLPYKQALSIVALIAMGFALLFSWIDVSQSTDLRKVDKNLIRVFLLPVILSLLFIAYKPLMPLSVPFIPVSLAILIYYTFKYQHSEYLTEELTVMNLFGIELALRLVKGAYILLH
ncbi:MAG: hypothetical protein JWM14_1823 [Chitinophagaceae bacterium]|nr:hypothetical protein [Chitinophagaceae bacterium]